MAVMGTIIGRSKIPKQPFDRDEVRNALAHVMNINSVDTALDTPDWVLADYLIDSLKSLDKQNHNRDQWFGWNREPKNI
jgi:hypothetical protein